jgi:hypothetical protein
MSRTELIESLESRTFLSVSPSLRAVTGTRDLLYVRVRFSDQSGYALSESSARTEAANAVAKIVEYSGGNVRFTSRVASVALSRTQSYYKNSGTGRLADDVDAKLRASGMTLTGFEHVSYRYSGSLGSWAGLGQVGGKRTWIQSGGYTVLVHELGHNLRLGHSAFANPTGSNPFGSASVSAYGDVFSNMGYGGTRDWTASQKRFLGWLDGNRTRTIDASRSGTFTIDVASHDNASTYSSSNVYLVRVKLSSSSYLTVEYRSGLGGVLIHKTGSSGESTTLIDATPSTSSASDAMLKSGRSLVNTRGSGSADDVRFTVVSAGSKAKVTIKIGG